MRLPPALRGFLAASALFTLLCLGTEAFCRWVLHWGDPYDYPGIRVSYGKGGSPARFADFHSFFDKFHFFHSRLFYTESAVLPYPPAALTAYKLFLIPAPSPHHGTWALARFEGALLLASWIMLFFWRRALVRAGQTPTSASLTTLGTYVCSFAFWFESLQGNIEWVVWVLLSLAIWAFCREHFKTAAVLIGIAGAMKIFPIIFVGLFIPIRRYREAALTLVSAACSTVISLWLVCPELAYSWHQTILALTSFEHGYVAGVRPVELGFDHSLFALCKILLTDLFGMQTSQRALAPYLLVCAFGGVALFFLRIRHLPITNQVLCLTVAAILLPPVSYDYTLIHLYAGLVLLSLVAVQNWQEGSKNFVNGLAPALVLLAFLLSPESELIWHGNRFAAQSKAIALLALGFVALRWPFTSSAALGLRLQPVQNPRAFARVPAAEVRTTT